MTHPGGDVAATPGAHVLLDRFIRLHAAHLDRAAGSAQHLASLIGDLGRLGTDAPAPHLATVAATELIVRVVDEVRVVHGGTHPVTIDAPADAAVHADPHLLRRVLTNLIGNAVRHTPVGTVVTVTVSPCTDEGGTGRRTITVEDNGTGFDPDAPTERLGLLLVRELTQRMGGTLTIDARSGRGTRAVVSLGAPCPPM